MVLTVDGIGVQVGGIIGGDEAAPLGGVIPGVAVIQAGIFVVVIATIANRVGLRHSNIGGFTGNGAVAPRIYFTMIYASSQEKATQIKMTWVALVDISRSGSNYASQNNSDAVNEDHKKPYPFFVHEINGCFFALSFNQIGHSNGWIINS